MYQTSLSLARIYPQQGLVVPASRKMKSSVAAEIKVNGVLLPTIYWSLREAMVLKNPLRQQKLRYDNKNNKGICFSDTL